MQHGGTGPDSGNVTQCTQSYSVRCGLINQREGSLLFTLPSRRLQAQQASTQYLKMNCKELDVLVVHIALACFSY